MKGNYCTTVFYNIANFGSFFKSMQNCIDQAPKPGVFVGDNLFTFGKNLSFINDSRFLKSFHAHTETEIEKAVIWRTYVLVWAARRGMKLEGDFVECGTYRGINARIVAESSGLKDSGRRLYLYDLFEHSPDMNHHRMPAHHAELYDEVCGRFADMDNVTVVKGCVPETLSSTEPEKIAFLHVDMNNAEAEIGALQMLFDRVSDGALIVLDDYGWLPYQNQKLAEDAFFAERGLEVLELPTGQGLVIK